MKDTDFANSSAYLRVQEKHILSSSSIDRIVDAPSTHDALRMLSQNTDYDFSSLARSEDYEGVLKAELKRVYAMAYKLADSPAIVDILGAKYDYHNIKTAIKAKHYPGTEQPFINVTRIAPEDIVAAVNKPDSKTALPKHILNSIAAGEDAFIKTGSPQNIDIALDSRMYAHMLTLCKEVDNAFIKDYVTAAVDFHNVKTLMRVKNMKKGTAFLADCLIAGGRTDTAFFIEHYNKPPSTMAPVFSYKYYGDAVKKGLESYEKNGNYSFLEKVFDDYLIEHTKQAKFVTFGPEILFAYLVSKENEIRQIRILVTCKLNNIGADILKERLRVNYA